MLGRAGAGAGEHVRCLRRLRGRADPDQFPRDPACEPADPSRRLHAPGAADGGLDVRHLLRLAGGDADAGRDPLPRRAGRETDRLAPAGAAGAARVILGVTPAEKYVAAAYGIVFLVVLVYVLIIALKLGRLERELDELTGVVRERREAEQEQREEVPVG
ncbi:MAG: CcmD family protein [Actinobacteria bacterium]|nr:MAG: CcmD family protein [Actinomycetota bacterium]